MEEEMFDIDAHDDPIASAGRKPIPAQHPINGQKMGANHGE
jgi:hypothetical protein